MALARKHVWIIGASSGIGLALAQLYATSGWQVTASARSEQALKHLSTNHQTIARYILDVTEPDCYTAILDHFLAEGTLPDLVIYCAATYNPGGLSAVTHDAATHHMQVNYLGLISLVEMLTPHMERRGHGHLAVIASLSGYCGLPNAALYGPTKAALINFCETIKSDYDELGLGLSIINPGFVKTPMTDKNTFAMPFLLQADEAAEVIRKGLARRAFEITFPWQLAFALKCLRKLPYWLYFLITKRLQS